MEKIKPSVGASLFLAFNVGDIVGEFIRFVPGVFRDSK